MYIPIYIHVYCVIMYTGMFTVVPRRKTLEWCIENEFELVELNPIQDDSDSDHGEDGRTVNSTQWN